MMSRTLGAFIELDNNAPKIAGPPPVLPKSYPSLPDTVELEQLTWSPPVNRPDSITRTAITPSGLEMSQPRSPRRRESADVVQSFSKLRGLVVLVSSLIVELNVDFIDRWAFTVQA